MHRNGLVNQIYWVARTDSDAVPEEFEKSVLKTTDLWGVLNNIESLEGVFLCRSGVWSPPHLDMRLNTLIKKLCVYYGLQDIRMPNRYTKEFKDLIMKYNKVYKQAMKHNQMLRTAK